MSRAKTIRSTNYDVTLRPSGARVNGERASTLSKKRGEYCSGCGSSALQLIVNRITLKPSSSNFLASSS